MTLKSKICGITSSNVLKFIVNHKFPPQFVGFIVNYPKSKRYVEPEKLKTLINIDKKKTKFVAVLVKPNEKILEKIKNFNFDYYQIYDCSPMEIKTIKNKYDKKIISAITVENESDINKYKDFLPFSDIVLFDSKGYEKSIGFDHSLLEDIPNDFSKMIAGNIKIDDIFNYKDKNYIIDISGDLEDLKGEKNIDKIDKFLLKVNKI